MPKKSVQSFCHWVRMIELSSWFNISPYSFTSRYSSCGWASRGRSSRFCFGIWSACKSKYIHFQRKCFRLRLRSILLVVVVLFCCSSPWPTCSIHEKFKPTSENCLCLQNQFWFPLHIYLVGSWLWLPIRVQFCCSIESNLSGQLNVHLVAKCTQDMSLVL